MTDSNSQLPSSESELMFDCTDSNAAADDGYWPRYQLDRSYRWNYEHSPEACLVDHDVADYPGQWTFCGHPVPSPIGMPAGPLLNGRWILYYANLGFDVLTYKTVRSGPRECYPLPNLVPVEVGMLTGTERQVSATSTMQGSWAVSFGMPSALPDVWRKDIEWTRQQLSDQKLLSVSVVGTVKEGWGITELAEDYAICARWAVESGADTIEMNFSCPNVVTCDGQLYQQPQDARAVAEAVKSAAQDKPVIAKIGHMNDPNDAQTLLDAIGDYVDALAMTNSVAALVEDDSRLLFDGQRRGICGRATMEASIGQVKMFSTLIKQRSQPVKIIGVGGASSYEDVSRYLEAGAESVHIATAAMVNPAVGLAIREAASHR